jgi:hypothetical protein
VTLSIRESTTLDELLFSGMVSNEVKAEAVAVIIQTRVHAVVQEPGRRHADGNTPSTPVTAKETTASCRARLQYGGLLGVERLLRLAFIGRPECREEVVSSKMMSLRAQTLSSLYTS